MRLVDKEFTSSGGSGGELLPRSSTCRVFTKQECSVMSAAGVGSITGREFSQSGRSKREFSRSTTGVGFAVGIWVGWTGVASLAFAEVLAVSAQPEIPTVVTMKILKYPPFRICPSDRSGVMHVRRADSARALARVSVEFDGGERVFTCTLAEFAVTSREFSRRWTKRSGNGRPCISHCAATKHSTGVQPGRSAIVARNPKGY